MLGRVLVVTGDTTSEMVYEYLFQHRQLEIHGIKNRGRTRYFGNYQIIPYRLIMQPLYASQCP